MGIKIATTLRGGIVVQDAHWVITRVNTDFITDTAEITLTAWLAINTLVSWKDSIRDRARLRLDANDPTKTREELITAMDAVDVNDRAIEGAQPLDTSWSVTVPVEDIQNSYGISMSKAYKVVMDNPEWSGSVEQ